MPAFTIIVLAAVAGLLVGSMLVLGAPYLAVPIAIVAIVAIGAASFRRRVRRAPDAAFPRDAGDEAGPVEFTERDRETLLPSADDEK